MTGAEFIDTDLRGARFVRSDLSGVVMRAVDVQGVDIDGPWLLDDGGSLIVNGVDVVPFVDAELIAGSPGGASGVPPTRRVCVQPGTPSSRPGRRPSNAVDSGLSAGVVDESVDGEWSFAQTLRHLVMATDVWLGKAILEREQPFHPLGQPNASTRSDGYDTSIFASTAPSYDEVLAVRAAGMGMVRDFIAGVSTDDLAGGQANPWAPQHPETTLSCLHVILGEEWEHHRYAVRDLRTIEQGTGT